MFMKVKISTVCNLQRLSEFTYFTESKSVNGLRREQTREEYTAM